MADDLLATVQAELSQFMVPWPDDFMEELSPPAALFLLRQTAMAVSKVITGGAIALDEDGDEEGTVLADVIDGVAICIAGSTSALVALDLLPREALDALAGAEEVGP